MKTLRIATLIAAALLTVGTASAQGRRGSGYGGPPRTDEERSARQEQRQNANGAICPKCGVCDGSGAGQGQGKVFGQGKGQGKGQRRGPRDGRGPRGGSGNCPVRN
jgi:hypothetical protein